MSLLDVLRSGVKIADKVTKPLQATVQYEHCTGNDQYGPTYAAKVPLKAIVDEKQQLVRSLGGDQVTSRCQITLLDVAAIVAATGVDGAIRAVDIFTLPDGSTGAILALGGFVDASTTHPIATDVWLG